jgi:putative membrane protein
MKQDCKNLVGLLTVGLLALAPVYAQSSSGAGQGQAAGQSSAGQSDTQTQKSRRQSTKTADQSANSANRMGSDQTFVTKAAHGGMAEVKLGTLATQKASNADVKAFGQQMVDDHSKANDELKQLASTKGITLPTDMDAKEQAKYDRLSKLSGAEFDRAYMKEMVSDHRTDVSEFRRESQSGTDPDVKAWAAKTLPTLEQHLQMAESTDAKVKK